MALPNTPPNKFASVLASASLVNTSPDLREPVNVASVENPAETQLWTFTLTQPLLLAKVSAGLAANASASTGGATVYPFTLNTAGLVTAITIGYTGEDAEYNLGFHILDTGW